MFGPDHPVTGGYPVVAVVADADTDRLAQAQAGRGASGSAGPERAQ
ncbi:biotin-dependent carboxyltransferase family protein [Nocardioides sp. W3-2-3]|nr:biotin-dependent carboxyltransferase family protein [Nocardioides convexus]